MYRNMRGTRNGYVQQRIECGICHWRSDWAGTRATDRSEAIHRRYVHDEDVAIPAPWGRRIYLPVDAARTSAT
jgi:hypothetical protein